MKNGGYRPNSGVLLNQNQRYKKYIKKINMIECIWKLFCEKFILGVFFYYELGLSLCHRAAISRVEHNAGMEGTQNDTHRIA